MATKVHMEALSPTMEEGQVVKWLKSKGDAVDNGEVLAEIETDKATMELTARGAGTLLEILVEEGGTAPVGEVIAVIGEEGEDVSDLVGEGGGDGRGEGDADAGEEADIADEAEGGAAEADAGDEGAPEPSEEEDEDEPSDEDAAGADADEEREAGRKEGGEAGGERIKASPLARRLADEAGLDLGRIEGSGPGGRIVKRDVEKAKEEGVGEEPAAEEAAERREWAAAPVEAPEEEHEDIAVSQMRKTIAKRLVQSIDPVPHFFLTIEVDMTRVMAARKRVNAFLEKSGRKVSVNDFVLKATASALRQHPEVNASWQGDAIRRYHVVHVGVAVAVEDGLITPVIRNADRKGMVQISEELKELAGRAREKKLKPEEYTGATFSVSNLGMFGIQEFTAVINPPEAGILAVGRVEETPVVEDGQVVAQPRMKVTMSCDHRVIDGATGARFLQTLRAMLEEPAAVAL